MKTILKLVFLLLVLVSFSSCDKDDDDNKTNNMITFKAVLNGASEVPANSSTATGTAVLTFDNVTKIFTVNVIYTGLTVTNAHIHKGAVGVSGSPVFGFSTFISPINYTSVALTTEQEADLKANLYYVNLHSSAYSGGEIRGQLIMQ
ncbi:CHRD domain-containing protein [Flavobacterium sp. NG2]|uniref:CHRD domain-containing protein n=1 Tax=Flavobacterium sp. NG2 TaxID=3097547 RepID=UPI002A7F6595|nr:CHRD domain-containing protein [Flavobacterium sp. NG2]WPR70592.1 CHRD domain-containing protein [Flavobacterium sp. NG2]